MTDTTEKPKRSGRKPKSADGGASNSLTRDGVIAHAMQLVQEETADAVTIARLASDLGVSTGLIHYFVGSRDAMLATVLNESRRTFVLGLSAAKGQWREDLETLLIKTHESKLAWKGITTYLAEHNRHRLFHDVASGERDYGLAYFDHFARIMKSGGFTADQAAHAYHLSMLFLESVAVSHLRHRAPANHKGYLLHHMSLFDAHEYEGAAYMMESFAGVSTESTFAIGLTVLLNAFESWLSSNAAQSASSKTRKATRKT
jgi:AcrR family transcriptional regulator